MRILLLADTSSEHTEKWALGLSSNGIEVGLFSFNKASYPWYLNKKNITILNENKHKLDTESVYGKLVYFKYLLPLKKAIKAFKPDVVHAHYATSYGLIVALSGFHPFVISAWGTDVMKFPQKNFINKAILKYNLKQADAICATSNTIKEYLKPVTDKEIHVIPFGVDVNEFRKKEVTSLFDTNTFVIGSVKALEELYNTDVLIKAFAKLKSKYPEKKIKLLIIGDGSQLVNLKELVTELRMENDVTFTGRIAFSQISNYFNMLDVLVNISDYESFGVSVIEAMACEKPVIATNTGGLKEIIENSSFGSLVEIKNVEQTTLEIENYFLNEDLKKQVGLNARDRVVKKYNWNDNIKQMINVYHQLIKKLK